MAAPTGDRWIDAARARGPQEEVGVLRQLALNDLYFLLTKILVHDEMAAFPVGIHDDLLDCISRIKDEDLGTVWPKIQKPKRKLKRRDARVV